MNKNAPRNVNLLQHIRPDIATKKTLKTKFNESRKVNRHFARRFCPGAKLFLLNDRFLEMLHPFSLLPVSAKIWLQPSIVCLTTSISLIKILTIRISFFVFFCFCVFASNFALICFRSVCYCYVSIL